MGVDQHREHAQRLVVLDESHTAHVGRQVVHGLRTGERLITGVTQGKIELPVLDSIESLMPLLEWLDIDRHHVRAPIANQIGDEMPTDKSASPAPLLLSVPLVPYLDIVLHDSIPHVESR